MQVVLCGKRWTLRHLTLSDASGECDGPHIRNKEIRIDNRLRGQEQLEVYIHEAMHAIDWKLDEEHVTTSSHDLARMLWKLGYRKTEQD